MREVNIAGLDLNLMPALEALLRLRNVTRAAEEVGLSQPAMSRALARLRDLLGDPLLVRTRGGYVLTPRATAIQLPLATAMRRLRHVFQEPTFDPAAEHRILRIAASDTQTILLIPRVMARLAIHAPGVELRVEAYGPNLFERMESGTLDFAFALQNTPLPSGAYSEFAFEDRLALVMRRGHPAAGRTWSITDYGACDHVGVALFGDGVSEIDAMLAAQGVTRRIALVTPYFMGALAAVAATDLVTTISASLARRYASTLDLVLMEPPFDNNHLIMTLVCSHIRMADPFLGWFRSLVRDVGREVE